MKITLKVIKNLMKEKKLTRYDFISLHYPKYNEFITFDYIEIINNIITIYFLDHKDGSFVKHTDINLFESDLDFVYAMLNNYEEFEKNSD